MIWQPSRLLLSLLPYGANLFGLLLLLFFLSRELLTNYWNKWLNPSMKVIILLIDKVKEKNWIWSAVDSGTFDILRIHFETNRNKDSIRFRKVKRKYSSWCDDSVVGAIIWTCCQCVSSSFRPRPMLSTSAYAYVYVYVECWFYFLSSFFRSLCSCVSVCPCVRALVTPKTNLQKMCRQPQFL